MSLEELRMLDEEIITEEQYDLISEMEGTTIENNGGSGLHINRTWYTVYIDLGEEIEEVQVYL